MLRACVLPSGSGEVPQGYFSASLGGEVAVRSCLQQARGQAMSASREQAKPKKTLHACQSSSYGLAWERNQP